jgi:disulfide bond formation protein DsbB
MSATSAPPAPKIDPRGARFAAALTTALLAVALIAAPSTLTIALLAAQCVFFAIGAARGVQHTPYAWLFRSVVRPRLGQPSALEDAAPPRFAQGVGLVFAVVALGAYAAGVALVGDIATGLALAAAFLNAAFGFCLGCEIYLLLKRLAPSRITPSRTPSTATKG